MVIRTPKIDNEQATLFSWVRQETSCNRACTVDSAINTHPNMMSHDWSLAVLLDTGLIDLKSGVISLTEEGGWEADYKTKCFLGQIGIANKIDALTLRYIITFECPNNRDFKHYAVKAMDADNSLSDQWIIPVSWTPDTKTVASLQRQGLEIEEIKWKLTEFVVHMRNKKRIPPCYNEAFTRFVIQQPSR